MTTADVRMCGFPTRVSVEQALASLLARVTALASERVPITEAADRVAAKDVAAEIAVPSFRRAMMDGYAVIAEDTTGASTYQPRRLRVVGDVRAGRGVPERVLANTEAMRITTGAPVPQGADAVLMVEHTETIATDAVNVLAAVSPGKHIAPIGEDVNVGDRLVQAGRRLRPQDAGVLASAGVASVAVVRRPRVCLLLTGDELVAPGQRPTGSQIIDANSVVLAALCRRDGAAALAVHRLRDDPQALRDALASADADVVLVSGGSSVGPEDHAPQVIAALGELVVHGVAMRPSSPAGFGFIGNKAVFLLPGNPVSCLCAYEFFAGPAIRVLGGRPSKWPHRSRVLPVAEKLVSVLGRCDYMRVRIADDSVFPIMTSGASILSSTTRADGVVIIPDQREGYPVGEAVTVLLYDGTLE